MNRTADIVIDSYDNEAEAVTAMRKLAGTLRQRRVTGRYGVYIERRRGAHWVILRDRGRA